MILAELIYDPAWDLREEIELATGAGLVALLIAAVIGALALIQRRKIPKNMRSFWLFLGCGIALLVLSMILSRFHKGPIFDGMKKGAQPNATDNSGLRPSCLS